MVFKLAGYLARIGLEGGPSATLSTLTAVMNGHMRSIPFENISVVQGKKINMGADDVFDKLVTARRGGYCFEQNNLLSAGLKSLGYTVLPILCRVRWGKKPDQETAFTHMCLKVEIEGEWWLADVGFAGTNSMAPVNLSIGDAPQQLPEGVFRVSSEGLMGGYSFLEMQDRSDACVWRALYSWNDVPALGPDLDAMNWFSCTFPSSRFTNQFFCCRIVDDERRHVLNDVYVRRKMSGEMVEEEKIESKERLMEIVEDVMLIQLPEDTEGIDKFLK